MATITITIPNPVANRVQDAISARYGYTGFLPNGTTPETKAEFTKRWIVKQLKDAVKEHEANTAAATATNTANTDVETNIQIT